MSDDRVAQLTHDIQIICEHIGVDLPVLRVITSCVFKNGNDCTWHAAEAQAELDELEECLDRGEPFPPACDARGKTLRRHLTAERSRRVVIG